VTPRPEEEQRAGKSASTNHEEIAMEIGPIFRAMLRNKIGVALIALQIAFTLTVVVNAVFIINERSRLMARPSGLDEANLFYLFSTGFQDGFSEEAALVEDRALLESIDGFASMSVVSAIPLSGSGSSNSLWSQPDTTRPSVGAAYYRVDPQAIDTMGLELLAGENFNEADMVDVPAGVNDQPVKTIVSLSLAEALFPGEGDRAVGRFLYMPGGIPVQIVGVVRQLQAPWSNWTGVENTMMVPANRVDGNSIYLVRAEPGRLNELMLAAEERLAAANAGRLITGVKSLPEAREQSYRIDSSMSRILQVVIVTLVFITSMGIVGLAVHGINRRRRQIGTRRALGATQGEIVRYFVIENLVISSLGVMLGALLTIGFNIFLVQAFNMPRIDWYYTPLGMLALIVVGLLAVLGPSRAASRIAPALATRTV